MEITQAPVMMMMMTREVKVVHDHDRPIHIDKDVKKDKVQVVVEVVHLLLNFSRMFGKRVYRLKFKIVLEILIMCQERVQGVGVEVEIEKEDTLGQEV